MSKTKEGKKAEKDAEKLAGANPPVSKEAEKAAFLAAKEAAKAAKLAGVAPAPEEAVKPQAIGKFYLHEKSGRVVNEFGQFVSPECDLSEDIAGTERLKLTTLVKRFNRARGWK